LENQPVITCVIPTFNDRVNLPRAVASALTQFGVEVEVLLVDDRSDDATREFIARFAATDPRIRTFMLPHNGGQGQARNIGAMLARGRYVAFMDQDDEHEQGWYAFAAKFLDSSPEHGAISGHARVIEIPARFGIDETDLRIRGLAAVFVTNMVFRRSVFLASGGFPVTPVWRSKAAGEDGIFRRAIAGNWRGASFQVPALLHRAKEGGATCYFLDRTVVEGDRVVVTRHEEIERNGVLEAAEAEYYAQAARIAREVAAAVNPPAAS
jgi:glycosyltransferase involved in cell wall biosynthesis